MAVFLPSGFRKPAQDLGRKSAVFDPISGLRTSHLFDLPVRVTLFPVPWGRQRATGGVRLRRGDHAPQAACVSYLLGKPPPTEHRPIVSPDPAHRVMLERSWSSGLTPITCTGFVGAAQLLLDAGRRAAVRGQPLTSGCTGETLARIDDLDTTPGSGRVDARTSPGRACWTSRPARVRSS